jgi:hypothetical protein
VPENPEKSEKNYKKLPKKENLMDYIIKFDVLKNPKKSKENYKNYQKRKF